MLLDSTHESTIRFERLRRAHKGWPARRATRPSNAARVLDRDFHAFSVERARSGNAHAIRRKPVKEARAPDHIRSIFFFFEMERRGEFFCGCCWQRVRRDRRGTVGVIKETRNTRRFFVSSQIHCYYIFLYSVLLILSWL